MKACFASLVLLVTFLFAVNSPSETRAQVYCYSDEGPCFDAGSPNRYYGNYRNYYPGLNYNNYRRDCGNRGYGVYPGYGVVPWSANYGGGWGGGHAHWHDTTHLDYHPGEYVRHRNHYHYIPGHYDVHVDGHWDIHD